MRDLRRIVRAFGCLALVALLLLLLLCGLARTPVRADGAGAARTDGLSPDLQVTGGVGFGLGGALENYFLARGRLGLLYAHDPWVANAGVTFEAGALGRLGIGCELEFNLWEGWYVDLGLARVEGADWMSHVSAGFTVLGVEWQQRFDSKAPSHALLLEVRLPIGMWWFFVGRKSDTRTIAEVRARAASQPPPPPAAAGALGSARAAPTPAARQPKAPLAMPAPDAPPPAIISAPVAPPTAVMPTPPLAAAAQAQGTPSGAATASGAGLDGAELERTEAAASAPKGPTRSQREQIDQATAESRSAQQRGDHVAAIAALERAYAIYPEPSLLLQLAEAEEASSSLLRAAGTLRKFLSQADPATKPQVQARLDAIQYRLPQLRLELSSARGDELVELDGKLERGATLGYDVPLDPGPHRLVLLRAGQPLAEREFNAEESKLTRIAIDLARANP